MNITQWTREREQKLAAANRKARDAYVKRCYEHGWRDGNGPRTYETAPTGGMFDFLETAAFLGALWLFFLGMRWLLF